MSRSQPTTSVDVALARLAEHGWPCSPMSLDPAETPGCAGRLLDAAERSELRGLATRDYDFDPDGNNAAGSG